MDMIERVARAMREYPTGKYDHAEFPLRPDELGKARAAIEATREWALASMKDHPFAEAWSDVVDAALKE